MADPAVMVTGSSDLKRLFDPSSAAQISDRFWRLDSSQVPAIHPDPNAVGAVGAGIVQRNPV